MRDSIRYLKTKLEDRRNIQVLSADKADILAAWEEKIATRRRRTTVHANVEAFYNGVEGERRLRWNTATFEFRSWPPPSNPVQKRMVCLWWNFGISGSTSFAVTHNWETQHRYVKTHFSRFISLKHIRLLIRNFLRFISFLCSSVCSENFVSFFSVRKDWRRSKEIKYEGFQNQIRHHVSQAFPLTFICTRFNCIFINIC
jgi:hypothetical protein